MQPSNCTLGDVRLVGGSAPEKGRVEICISGVWATISSNNFYSQAAHVVCAQLGYSGCK